MADGDCVRCGHPAGHHDDEPAGCWDCDCDAWSGATDEQFWRDTYALQWAIGTHPNQAPCLDCGGTFGKPLRCTARSDGSHRFPPFPG